MQPFHFSFLTSLISFRLKIKDFIWIEICQIFIFLVCRIMNILIYLLIEIHIRYICPYATLNTMYPEEKKISAIKSIIAASSSILIDPLLSNNPFLDLLFLFIRKFCRCKNSITANSIIAAITKVKDIKRYIPRGLILLPFGVSL